MRLWKIVPLWLLAASCLIMAEDKKPADYPLRISIFGRSQTTFYRFHEVDEAKGDGRANLFDGNGVHGVDFNYDCSQKLRASFGYETYPARWKKPGKELVVLFPVFGKTGSYWTCNLNTDVKDFTYFRRRDGELASEPEAQYVDWMTRHNYDPVHGKDTPTQAAPPPAAPSAPSAH